MKCPIDQTELVMSERQGVEIDYCPSCRGVWLDRGELDKIIDRSNELAGIAAGGTATPAQPTPGVPAPGPGSAPGHVPPSGYPAPGPVPPSGYPDPRYRGGYGSAPSAPSPDDYHRGHQGYDQYGRPHRRKRKEGWLGELFDF